MAKTGHQEWTDRTKRFIKAELKHAEVTYEHLAEKMSDLGWTETKASVANKIGRGAFPASFFLVAMKALGREHVRLEEVQVRPAVFLLCVAGLLVSIVTLTHLSLWLGMRESENDKEQDWRREKNANATTRLIRPEPILSPAVSKPPLINLMPFANNNAATTANIPFLRYPELLPPSQQRDLRSGPPGYSSDN